MERELWILLGWSPEYGAPTTAVAVVGVEQANADIVTHVEWVPREYESSQTWRERIASTSAEDLPMRLELWQHDTTAPASPVEPLSSNADLATAVQIQVDDLIASAH